MDGDRSLVNLRACDRNFWHAASARSVTIAAATPAQSCIRARLLRNSVPDCTFDWAASTVAEHGGRTKTRTRYAVATAQQPREWVAARGFEVLSVECRRRQCTASSRTRKKVRPWRENKQECRATLVAPLANFVRFANLGKPASFANLARLVKLAKLAFAPQCRRLHAAGLRERCESVQLGLSTPIHVAAGWEVCQMLVVEEFAMRHELATGAAMTTTKTKTLLRLAQTCCRRRPILRPGPPLPATTQQQVEQDETLVGGSSC